MITRIEIDGFKSFTDFALDLEPFTVIAGVNGVGKSNLFDALRHLNRLVGGAGTQNPSTLRAAFESSRGSLHDLFTQYSDQARADTMRFVVELLLAPAVIDPYGVKAKIQHRRVRYELKVGLQGDTPRLLFERLTAIPRRSDTFLKRNKELRAQLPTLKSGRTSDFIATESDRIVVRQDRKGGRKHPIPLAATTSTALSSISDVTFPHAYATRRALADLHFLQLEPDALRSPSPFAGPTDLTPRGEGLPAVMARIERTDATIVDRIANDVARIVPGIHQLMIRSDHTRNEWSLDAAHVDGDTIPARLISDGTLRIVTLATLVHDPEARGTVILEEPENGVYAGRATELLRLLHSFAHSRSGEPWTRQLLVNTHSVPLVCAMREAEMTHSLLFAFIKRAMRVDRPPHRATVIAPVQARALQERLFDSSQMHLRAIAFSEMERLLTAASGEDAV